MGKKFVTSAQELNDLQHYGRRECIQVVGIPKRENENTEEVAIKVFNEIGVKISQSNITACHRMPSRKGDPTIIAKFILVSFI